MLLIIASPVFVSLWLHQAPTPPSIQLKPTIHQPKDAKYAHKSVLPALSMLQNAPHARQVTNYTEIVLHVAVSNWVWVQ